jgi:hypothetical protein
MILQVSATTVDTAFTQYGVIGVVALLLGYFAWGSYNRLVKKNDALERKVDALQEEMTSLLLEERDRMAKIVEENTRAINDLRSIVVNTLIRVNHES